MYKNFLKNFIIPTLVGVVIAILIRSFVFQFYTVDGASMEPTFEDSNLVLGYTFNALMDNFEHSDIIIVKYFNEITGETDNYVKRIIGLGHDVIEFKNIENNPSTQVYLNGNLLDEYYIKEDFHHPDGIIEVPENKIFVMGDNRNNSSDSRNLGFFDYDDVISTVNHVIKK